MKKRLRHSVPPGIVLGELRALGGSQLLGRLHDAARRKVLALARAKAAAEARGARRRRCNRFPAPAPNTRLTRRCLRPLATAGEEVGLV